MASSVKFTEATEISSADKEAVNLQVDRLLSSSHFRNSRRYTDLLRFVVQQTLEGRADSLKERTLGIEVFGREPNFDTAGDSIVRVAAAGGSPCKGRLAGQGGNPESASAGPEPCRGAAGGGHA